MAAIGENQFHLVGAHCSIEGGHEKAVYLGSELGCEVVQVFTKSSRQWSAVGLQAGAASRLRQAKRETGINEVFGHAGYLINLASKDRGNLGRSRTSLLDELQRCSELGLPFLVLHPGAHLGEGEEAGLKRILESLDWVFTRYAGKTKVAMEATCGQGTTLGGKVEHLAYLVEQSAHAKRLAVCLDTCHLFAAGYDLRTPEAIDRFIREFKRHLAWSRVLCLHLNDSKGDLGSRLDRHELLGKGKIGWRCFETIVNHPAFARIPLCLETPKGEGNTNDAATLCRLKEARKGWDPCRQQRSKWLDRTRRRPATDREQKGGLK